MYRQRITVTTLDETFADALLLLPLQSSSDADALTDHRDGRFTVTRTVTLRAYSDDLTQLQAYIARNLSSVTHYTSEPAQ